MLPVKPFRQPLQYLELQAAIVMPTMRHEEIDDLSCADQTGEAERVSHGCITADGAMHEIEGDREPIDAA